MDLAFVILTWNSERYIARCLNSITEQCAKEHISVEIHIVDNGSTDRTLDIITEFQECNTDSVHLHPLDSNHGTTYSRNVALKQTRSTHVCILDSDTFFVSGSIADALLYLDRHPDIGILAPMLVLPDGTVQHSAKKFPTFLQKMAKACGILRKSKPITTDYYSGFPFATETPIDTAISACWILRQTVLQKVGYLDENIFYSPEDLDYCVRMWLSHQKVVFTPHLVFMHNTQQISHKSPFSTVSLSHFTGLLYYFRKHRGWVSNRSLYNKIAMTH